MTTLSAEQIAQYAYAAGFRNSSKSQDLTIAVAVALAESSGRTNAKNQNSDSHRSVDYGLWQINGYWNAKILASGNWSDPADNARMAFAVFTEGGWKRWTTFTHATYFEHMITAMKAANAVQSGTVTTLPSTTTPAGNMDTDSSGITASVKTITDPHTWLRLGMITTGGILVLVALVMLGWNNAPQSVKTAAKAVAFKKVPIK